MNKIGYIVNILVFLYLMLEIVMERAIPYALFVVLLLLIAVTIFKERFYHSIYLTIVMLVLTCAAVTMDLHFAILFGLVIYDFILYKKALGVIVAFGCSCYFLVGTSAMAVTVLVISFCGLLAFVLANGLDREERFTQIVDNERRLRYELEHTKAKLLHSSKEIATITEVKERNRIARDIHDSIGHSIAGILMQLQAAFKLHTTDQQRAMDILGKSIAGLSDSVELLRNTVHNIKPKESVGVDYFHKIVNNYSFCPVDLNMTGDFNALPAEHVEIISTNMKEALTNAARYSQATKIDISIEASPQYTRLYVKDNGIGSGNIKEGLGLSGMKERIKNLGGHISITGSEGFLIVCVIPRLGSEMFESTNSR